MGDSADNVPGVKVCLHQTYSYHGIALLTLNTTLTRRAMGIDFNVTKVSNTHILSILSFSFLLRLSTKGIGPKTASALLKHFGTVDAMYERLGLPTILQSLQVDEQTTLFHAVECKNSDVAVPSSSTPSRQSTTVVTTPMNDINDDGNGDVLEASIDARAIDALFARIKAASALTKKANKKTPKNKKKDGILSEEEDEGGGMLLMEVSEEQRLVALALAELEISLQGVGVYVTVCLHIIVFISVDVVSDTLLTCVG